MPETEMISIGDLERTARMALIDLIDCTCSEWGRSNSMTIASLVSSFEKIAVDDYVKAYMEVIDEFRIYRDDGVYVYSPRAQAIMISTRAIISDTIRHLLDETQEKLKGAF